MIIKNGKIIGKLMYGSSKANNIRLGTGLVFNNGIEEESEITPPTPPGPSPNDPIVFADSAVKTLCVDNWGGSVIQGEITYGEAAAVTSLGEVFKYNQITSFDELQYFSGITSLDESFSYCSSLSSITLPNSVASIGYAAFISCALTSITIPDSVTSIGTVAFAGCESLTSITIPNSVTSIGSEAFSSCQISSITIPNSVTSVGSRCFNGCSSLVSITFGSSVSSIGNQVLQGCSNLASITSLATTAPSVGYWTFYGISNGGTLYVPQGSTGYDVWMQNANYYLGLFGWTKVNQ